MTSPTSITVLLQSAQKGDHAAAQQLWANVYDEIRRIAQRAVDQEFGPKSIQATELAHEAYLRLAGREALGFENRSHLLATVARAIRRMLVDRSRARNADKRGGQWDQVPLDDILDPRKSQESELLDLNMALEELETSEPRQSQLVEMRYFGGMTLEEAAEALNISVRTAASDWAFAKAWLRRRLDSR